MDPLECQRALLASPNGDPRWPRTAQKTIGDFSQTAPPRRTWSRRASRRSSAAARLADEVGLIAERRMIFTTRCTKQHPMSLVIRTNSECGVKVIYEIFHNEAYAGPRRKAICPLLQIRAGCRALDLGSNLGASVQWLIDKGAEHVTRASGSFPPRWHMEEGVKYILLETFDVVLILP